MGLLPSADRLGHALEGFLAATPGTPGAAAAFVDADGRVVEAAAGSADPVSGEALTTAHGMRIASSTKPFVAAALLRAVEQGRLALDDPVGAHVPPDVQRLLERRRHGERITVRHLLQHTSGLPDHTTLPSFVADLLAQPHREQAWMEQLISGFDMDPVGEPGERFSYSDTGYVLVARVLESCTGLALHEAVRAQVGFDALGLTATWWEAFEPPPSPGTHRAHQLLAGTDTHDWTPTFDSHGGGGLVATMADLARFWHALFGGEVHGLLHLQTERLVSTTAPAGEPFVAGEAVGLGLFRLHGGDQLAWGHGGFWGTREVHLPAIGVSLALGVTNRDPGVDLRIALLEPLIGLLAPPPSR